MHFPRIHGVIDRRILVNYRVAAEVLSRLVPRPFRLHFVNGFGMAGICLIRLNSIRLRGLPAWAGIGSENAAHRISVEWDEDGEIRHGVYVPRRDSSSLWNTLTGGRVFPGVHHHSRFSVVESSDDFQVEFESRDGTRVAVAGAITQNLPAASVFESLQQASEFFRAGSVGYSPALTPGCCEGLELCTRNWNLTPLAIRRAASTFYSDRARFPAGSIEFDSAFLMRGIAHEWHRRRSLTTSGFPAAGHLVG